MPSSDAGPETSVPPSGGPIPAERYAPVVGVRWARRAIGAALAAALWPALSWVFATDRGIGFRDEGLYLLAADPPSSTARWVTPFGWDTAPIFRWLGHDVADFRTFGLWALVVAGAWFGHLVGRSVAPADGARTERTDHVVTAATAATGALGAPFLVSGFLRTPGYNWDNLLGLLVAAGGVLLARRLAPDGPAPWRDLCTHGAGAAIAAGVWFTVPAKPSSAPLFAAAAVAVLAPHLRRRTWAFAGLTTAWGAVWTVVGLAAGWWPANFLAVLWRSATFPPLHENQTMAGAFVDVLRTPKVALHDLRLLRPAALVMMAVAALTTVVVVRRRAGVSPWVRAVPLTVAVLAAVGTATPLPLLGLPEPFVRFAWFGTTDAAVLLFVGALLHALAHHRTTDPERLRRGLAAAGLCIGGAVIFGFGSALSIYHQAALAAPFLWCASAAVVAGVGAPRVRTGATATIAVAAAVLLAGNVAAGRRHVFDTAPIADQRTPTVLGRYGDTLRLDAATSAFVTGLRALATGAGFCAGDRVIGMEWGWSSTSVYAIGGRVPEHLIMTIFGYPDAAEVLDVTMHDLTDRAWRDAWVLTDDPDQISDTRAVELRDALDRLPAAIGRTFPRDYTLAGTVDHTQLWRPADVAPRCG